MKEKLETRLFYQCKCLVCSSEDWSPMTREINFSDDPLYIRGTLLYMMSQDTIRELPRAKIDEYEQCAIDFLTKYDRFHPVEDTITMQLNLHMLWYVISTRF